MYYEMLIPLVNKIGFPVHGIIGIEFGGDGRHAVLQLVRNGS